MAMTVANNNAAAMALWEVNKNNSKLAKDLKKVSTGMKITGSADGASDYAISEKMRVLICALGQDIKNVQNGSSLLKTAMGGVDSIIDELRNIKELALNSANDTNTDKDREILNKTLQQKILNINDTVTNTTYNDQILLDGRYFRGRESVNVKTQQIAHGSLELTKGSLTKNVVRGFFPSATDRCRNRYYSEFSDKLGYDLPIRSTPFTYTPPTADDPALSDFTDCFDWGYMGVYETKIDFSNLNIDGAKVTDPLRLHGQGFSLTCQTNCHAHCEILFDATLPKDTAVMMLPADYYGDSYPPVGYVVGLNGARTMKDVEDSMFNGIKKLTDGLLDIGYSYDYSNLDDFMKDLFGDMLEGLSAEQLDKVREAVREFYVSPFMLKTGERANVAQVSLDTVHNMQIAKNADGTYTIRGLVYGYWGYDGGAYIGDLEYATPSNLASSFTTNTITETTYNPGNPFVIHHGPKANQAMYLYFSDMRASAMGLNYVSLSSREKANSAIDQIESAIDYALNEATTLGAYYNRLELTKNNLEAQEENSISSESVIRDADMAKEMASFAKHNILSQSSQAMLSQANQNASSVLSMLQ